MSVYSNLRDKFPKIGYFSSVPAGMIDRDYLQVPRTFGGRIWQSVKIRVTYLLFLVLASVDLVVSGLMAVSYAISSLFTSDALQEERLAQQKQYATIFSKSLYALIGSIAGLINPKLVIFYFTPEKTLATGVTAGGGYHHASNAELKTPITPEELQQIVREASEKGDEIIPRGAGRSQGKQFIPEGSQKQIVIDLSQLKSITNVDPKAKTAVVGAGALWSDLQFEANKHKLAVKVMQASNVFSVGGSIGCNIHGWDYHSGMVSNTIKSMDIVNAQGNYQTLTPNDELFHLITGGFGLYGIVYSVTIELTDNEKLQRNAINVDPNEYANYFNQDLKDNPDTRLHLYRLSLDPNAPLSQGFTETYVKTDGKALQTPNFSIEPTHGTRTQRVLVNIARRFGWARKLWWDGERQDFLNNTPVATTNEIMQAPINAMFNTSVSEAEWLQEYFLPAEELGGFLEAFGSLLKKNDVVLLNATVRFVKQNDHSPLSYAHDGDRFAVVICFNQSLDPSAIIHARKWLREAQHLAVEKKGTYYLPYQDVASPDDFKRAYPRANEAQEKKKQIDPQQRFTSGLHQKYIMPPTIEKTHAHAVMKDEETKDAFKGFLANILQRVDIDKIYPLLEDILTYRDTHADIYQELCARLPEIMPSTLDDIRRKLNSLYAIKRELGAQAAALIPEDATINGIVEIGSPGRFIGGFREHFKVTGTIVAVNDEDPSFSDYIDANSWHPYDVFKKLDYDHLDSFNELEDNSADLITCYVGLHHFSPEKLDLFLDKLSRVLRDGGHFILDDHDVIDEKTNDMSHLAHMIFNAVNGVSLENEMKEIRNFQPIGYWQEQLVKHNLYGISGADVPMIRPGDPTRNRMIITKKSAPELTSTINEGNQLEISERNTSADWKNNGTPPPEGPLSTSMHTLFAANSNQDAFGDLSEHTLTNNNNHHR